jgi:hypothetical protein
VSEKWVREEQFWALGFSRNCRKGHAIKKLAATLQTEGVTYKLSVDREVKMGIPVNKSQEEFFMLKQVCTE